MPRGLLAGNHADRGSCDTDSASAPVGGPAKAEPSSIGPPPPVRGTRRAIARPATSARRTSARAAGAAARVIRWAATAGDRGRIYRNRRRKSAIAKNLVKQAAAGARADKPPPG